ncbi:MAG: hypothetical protein NTZ41_07720 [Sphingobacteriales bacterium]|nr:hypothetical protein [Sphingobacteriales bacterium]
MNKTILMLLLLGTSSLAIAKTNPLPNVNVFGFKYEPNCAPVTVSASVNGWQECGGYVTMYTVTSSCTVQPSSCLPAGIASAAVSADACAKAAATRKMIRLMTLLPPC